MSVQLIEVANVIKLGPFRPVIHMDRHDFKSGATTELQSGSVQSQNTLKNTPQIYKRVPWLYSGQSVDTSIHNRSKT
jgi:hypothetical protein